MTPASFGKRLAALEADRAVMSVRLTRDELEAAVHHYAASLTDPGEPGPRAVAY